MLAIALFALIPYILVASGAALYQEQVMRDIDASRAAVGQHASGNSHDEPTDDEDGFAREK